MHVEGCATAADVGYWDSDSTAERNSQTETYILLIGIAGRYAYAAELVLNQFIKNCVVKPFSLV
jgi:hypothetical protein